MNPDITKIIEKYLLNELSQSDMILFEEGLKNNPALREELTSQKSIHEAAKRSFLRTEVNNSFKKYKRFQNIKKGGIGLGIIIAIASTIFLLTSNLQNSKNLNSNKRENSNIKKEVFFVDNSPIETLKTESFNWSDSDTAFLSKQGILISVPKNALLLDGKPYNKSAIIDWQEALDGAAIIKAGLNTTADEKLLETQGMFSFSALTPEGKQLTINPKTGIYVQIPVSEYKDDMMLFDGEIAENGIVNWKNPRELEKIPVAIAMKELDFFPPDYEPKLNALKARKDKVYRDSLYLSFENGTESENSTKFEMKNNKSMSRNMSIDGIEKYISWNYSIEYLPNNEANIVATATLLDNYQVLSVNEKTKINTVGNPLEIRLISDGNSKESEPTTNGETPRIIHNAFQTIYTCSIFKKKIKLLNRGFNLHFSCCFQLCNGKSCLPEMEESSMLWIDSKAVKNEEVKHIPPSSVLAFWKSEFNNTLLATKEFEERMEAIHRTCDKSVLEIYTQNLNESMHELDRKVVEKGYSNFKDFENQRIGKLSISNPHLSGLQDFYKKAIKQFKEEEKFNRTSEQKKRSNWDTDVQNQRQKEKIRTQNRENQVFNEEYTFNHKNVRKQLGRVLGARIYGARPICNIDRFVAQTTVARKTGFFYDQVTKKTATIKYNSFKFQVENASKFNRLFTYLLPDKFMSYHRIDGENGAFNFPLNDEISYELLVVGITDKGYSFYQRTDLKEGDLGTLQLKEITEEQFDEKIAKIDEKRGNKEFQLNTEFNWIKKEKQNYVELRRRSDDKKFRMDVLPSIFPCALDKSGSVFDQLLPH